MMNKTNIEWTDFTWNPVTGCRHGCWYCYAQKISARWAKGDVLSSGHFNPKIWSQRLDDPIKRKAPAKIFVSSMGDLMGAWVPADWINQVIAIVKDCPQHTFQFLTKNPERYGEFNWPVNCWLGATATDNESWHHAIAALIQAAPDNITRFISCEPLLGPINPMVGDLKFVLDWLIIGALTGPGAKDHASDQAYIQTLIGAARSQSVPVFIKDNLKWIENIKEWPE